MFIVKRIFLLLLACWCIGMVQANEGGVARVKGKQVAVSSFGIGKTVFPQNNTFKFREDLPARLYNKRYTSTLIEGEGVSHVMLHETGTITIALSTNRVQDPGWAYTGEEFSISSARKYYLYTYSYTNPNSWLPIPKKLSTTAAPTLLIHDDIIWDDPLPLPGVLIDKTLDLEQVTLTNPTLCILPSGEYLAAISGALMRYGDKRITVFYLSSNQGETWKVQSVAPFTVNYGNLFVHEAAVYIMGTAGVRKEVIIAKSTDKGLTWTQPKDENSGVLLYGGYHSAPVPVIIHQDRIWRSMEYSEIETQRDAFVMSAPINADWLEAASWTTTNPIPYNTAWRNGNNQQFKQWIEGNAVVDRNGNVVNILRVDDEIQGEAAAICTLESVTEARFNPVEDIIHFPGGGKKFTIRYDSISDKYWAISNAVFEEDRETSHSGIYKNGIHCGLLRNRVVLMYSDNLRNWTVKDTLISSDDPFFHGIQYLDWQFDGDDIVAVSRTAFEEERGLPIRQHDANCFLFHRFSDFRVDRYATTQPGAAIANKPYSKFTTVQVYDKERYVAIKLNSEIAFCKISTFDGQLVSQVSFAYQTAIDIPHKGLYLVEVYADGEKSTHKVMVP